MRYHCAIDPLSVSHSSSSATRPVNYAHAQYTIIEVKDVMLDKDRYHCAIDPLSVSHSSSSATRPVNYAHAQYTIIEVKDVMLDKDRATF